MTPGSIVSAVRERINVRDLKSVIDLVQVTKPERLDLIAGLSHLHKNVCRHATDCRLCQAALPCERLLRAAFIGQWDCRD